MTSAKFSVNLTNPTLKLTQFVSTHTLGYFFSYLPSQCRRNLSIAPWTPSVHLGEMYSPFFPRGFREVALYEEARRQESRLQLQTDIKGKKATGNGTTQSSDSEVITSTLQA